LDNLVVGQRYRVYHRAENQRVLRFSIMDYLGRETHESYAGQGPNYLFNARPRAGTQSMPPHWIVDVQQVPKETPVDLNRIAKQTS